MLKVGRGARRTFERPTDRRKKKYRPVCSRGGEKSENEVVVNVRNCCTTRS